MTKEEITQVKEDIRNSLLEYMSINEPNVDVDLSRNTKTLYKWAVRNYKYPRLEPEKFEEIFGVISVKPEVTTDETKGEIFTELNELEDEIIEKNEETSDKETVIKKVVKEIKTELEKQPEETTKKDNSAIWWTLAILALIAAIFGLTKLIGHGKEN